MSHPRFTKSRTAQLALDDMRGPLSSSTRATSSSTRATSSAPKSLQALKQDQGYPIAEKWSPTLEALASQGYTITTTTNTATASATASGTSTTSATTKTRTTPATALPPPRIFNPIPKPRPGDWLDERHEAGQTFQSFLRGQFRCRPHGTYDTICVVILGTGVPHLANLSEYLSKFYQCNIQIVGPINIEDEKIVQQHGLKHRYNSDTKMKQFYCHPLMDMCSKIVSQDRDLCRRAVCTIGFTMFDLTPSDDYNFVYGLASLADGKGLFSMARFHPDFNGEKFSSQEEADKIIFKRCVKVASHELGHLCGLRHCINYVCLMNGANHAKELERQPLVECPTCTKKLTCTWSWDLKKRYADMVEACEKFGFKEEAAVWKQCLEFCQ